MSSTVPVSPVEVLAHCGAQTTADTAALAAHAAETGAAGVAVIAPPYYQVDEPALLAHFLAAARACAPCPFYVYELEKASGYAIPVAVIERLREQVENVAGLKVSDAPFEKVEPYLLDGLDVFIGAEALIGEGSRGRCRRMRVGARRRPSRKWSPRPCGAATRPPPANCGRRWSASRGMPP